MGKFIKDLIDKAKDKKARIFLNTKVVSKQSIETSYYFVNKAIFKFIEGKPSIKDVAIFEFGLIKSIGGNDEVKDKCKVILKEWKDSKIVSVENQTWLIEFLQPFVEKSMSKQIDKTFEAINALDENKVNEFIAKVKKEKEGRFK
jgi:hypothetical protein